MNFKSIVLCLMLGVLMTMSLLAQGQPVARVKGRVTESSGEVLTGVTVTLASPQLQGQRVLLTDANGVYNAPPVLPGDYEITFLLEGYQTLTRRVRLNASTHLTVDARLDLATVADEIMIIGEAVETISQSSTAAVTVTKSELDDLPVDRSLASAVALAPGVSEYERAFISGGTGWENLFTLNGVVLSDNVTGTAHALYIEDAIQETTTATAGISAEWGRFTGGVVTAITRSGGNRFEGSYRGTWTNEDWNGRNEFTPEDRFDRIQRIDEATLGGRIVRDHLWFFGAGRDFGLDETLTTSYFNIPYPKRTEQTRLEAKLTGGTPSHQLQLSHVAIDEGWTNAAHGGLFWWALVTDDGTLNPKIDVPSELTVASYNGVLTPNLFLEAQYGERAYNPGSYGGRDPAIGSGTPIWDYSWGVIYNESIWCDSEEIEACTKDLQDNQQARIQGTWFLSTSRGGSHDIAVGWERFSGILAFNEYESANSLAVWAGVPSELDYEAQRAFPTAPGNGSTLLVFQPIFVKARPPDYRTTSFFANDRWRLSDRWAFNLGLRYDANDSVNAAGLKVAEDSAWGPRLGATYDLGADGRNVFHASYSVYAGPQPEGIFHDTSPAGAPATFQYGYFGPPIGVDFDNQLDPVAANEVMWRWLAEECPNAIDFDDPYNVLDPFDCEHRVGVNIPGLTTIPASNLGSTTANEISLGYQHDFGRFGSLRVDWVHREFGDLFAVKRDLETGLGVTEQGGVFDQGIIVNDNDISERKYDGLQTAFSFRFLDSRLRLGGSYTWSHARGNHSEIWSSSVYSGVLEYPEYREVEWSYPRGDLAFDQRHRLRAWVQYDVLSSARQRLNVSWLENFRTGTPYYAGGAVDTSPYVTNPGYKTPPTSMWYVFAPRGGFRTDSLHSSDLAINYSLNFDRWELFIQPAVRNLFNEQAVLLADNGVLTFKDDPSSLEPFDPFTETPIEGVHWRKADNFGEAWVGFGVQEVRTVSFTAGVRFNP